MGTVGYPLKATTSKQTEFDILKEYHQFLRNEGEKPANWNEALAEKYYSSLWREFAVCDLKHFKSGNFSLRWRTEDEVLSAAGESTCGNTRCAYHPPPNPRDFDRPPMPSLKTIEVPFGYTERGENKSALVKLVLCGKCLKKLMWKREKDKEERLAAGLAEDENVCRPKEASSASALAEEKTEKSRNNHKRSRNRSQERAIGTETGFSHRSTITRDSRPIRKRDDRSQSPRR